MKVLVADDDAVSRRLLQATLARLGHEVTVVANGSAAIEVLVGPDAPRLAILDWQMPGADGLAVCRAARVRADRYVYVLLLTAHDRREDLLAALDAEADDFLTKPFDIVELQARLRSGERVLALQERLLETQEALRHEATHDRVTGLWNRGMISDQLTTALQRMRREGHPIAVILADVDRFKQVNDRYGHAAGDAVLREVAARMRSVLRSYDSIGRYGGEEFLFVLPGADATVAAQIAERARQAAAASPIDIGASSLPVTVSFGVAATREAPADPAALVADADAALYRAKAGGRNRVE